MLQRELQVGRLCLTTTVTQVCCTRFFGRQALGILRGRAERYHGGLYIEVESVHRFWATLAAAAAASARPRSLCFGAQRCRAACF